MAELYLQGDGRTLENKLGIVHDPETLEKKEALHVERRAMELHPFREGNGRTQRLIWEHLAREAGHELSFEGISRERMTVVSIAASAGDYASARRMFAELLDPVRSHSLRTATRFLEANRTPSFDWQERYIATTEPGQSYTGTFVSAGGADFLMHDGRNLYIGQLADLPRDGRDLHAGDYAAFREGTVTSATPSKDLSVEERLREREGRQRKLEHERPLEREKTLEKPRGPSHDLDLDD